MYKKSCWEKNREKSFCSLVAGRAKGVTGTLYLGHSILKDGAHPSPFAALFYFFFKKSAQLVLG